jgi:hypothetical protein
MPLDLDKIRARHEPYADTRVGQDIAAMLSEIDRLTSELAAAQAGPVVGWYATTVGEAARVGMFWMGLGPGGWTLHVRLPYGFGAGELIDSGEETGDAGKAACLAAYRRACGFPTVPPCAG